MRLVSTLLSSVPGIQHGFGERAESIPSLFEKDWETLRPHWKQVHGTRAAEVLTPGQDCGEVDALYCRVPRIPVPVRTADCVPILLAARDGSAVAAVHAGWRGTRARILRDLWTALRAQGERPEKWVACIGPAIGPCCYEVSDDLARDFEKEFGPSKFCRPVPRPRHLDLPAINEAELRDAGLGQVEVIRRCTACSRLEDPASPETRSWRFNSYRRDGGEQRQLSVIRIDAK